MQNADTETELVDLAADPLSPGGPRTMDPPLMLTIPTGQRILGEPSFLVLHEHRAPASKQAIVSSRLVLLVVMVVDFIMGFGATVLT